MVTEKTRSIGPHSRPHRWAMLDGRTKEAALVRTTRDDLIRHCGGNPSAVQRQLIDRIAVLTLHVATFDAKAIEAGGLSERDSRQYLAYSNSLARALRQLGLQGDPKPAPKLADLFPARPAADAAA
jgi:hypothetical protein